MLLNHEYMVTDIFNWCMHEYRDGDMSSNNEGFKSYVIIDNFRINYSRLL